MLHETMSHAGLAIYTEIAMVIVLTLAAAILLYVLGWRKKSYWKTPSELPLSDGQLAVAADAASASTSERRSA